MKIQCRIKREGGSRVSLGNQEYHFAPDELGRHVAEVEDESHILRLLEIPQYSEVSDDGDPPVVPVTEGQTLTPQEGSNPTQDDDELEAARDEYEAYFGKKPHHMMKAETIRERIQQAKDANE